MNWILGSKSPRREQLFRHTGIPFQIQSADIDEPVLYPESAEKTAGAIARLKHDNLSPSIRESFLVTADTVVAVEETILTKPKNAAEAKAMLTMLSGKGHSVYTAVVLSKIDRVGTICQSVSFTERTDVFFHHITEMDIQRYLKRGVPTDKAGAYGIQDDMGAFFVRRIEGDYYNVVGFPLQAFYQTLKHTFRDEFEKWFSV